MSDESVSDATMSDEAVSDRTLGHETISGASVTEASVSDETTHDEARETGAGTEGPSVTGRSRRTDPVSMVAGLVFIAVAVLALVDRFWAEIDPVSVAGGAVIAVGVAVAAGAIRRSARGSGDGA